MSVICGGSSSAGQYTLQILRYYGYSNTVATVSPRNFDLVKACGAAHVVDYNSSTWQHDVLKAAGGKIDLVVDCIGSLDASVKPVAASLVSKPAKVAVLLPVIVRDASDDVEPIYTFDVAGSADWPEGVEAVGVRTHFYLQVCLFPLSADTPIDKV